MTGTAYSQVMQCKLDVHATPQYALFACNIFEIVVNHYILLKHLPHRVAEGHLPVQFVILLIISYLLRNC